MLCVCDSHRSEEHGEEVDHGLHVEAPLGSHTGCRQEHQAADCRQQHLGNKCTHDGWTANQTLRKPRLVDEDILCGLQKFLSLCLLQ